MSVTLREAAAGVVGCTRCGSDYRPWRTGGVCPLCAVPATADPLREALSPRFRAALDLAESTWRLVILGVVWVLVIATIVLVWMTDAAI